MLSILFFSPVQSAVVKVTEPVKNFVSYLYEMKNFKEENERLKSELETLKKESRNQEEYKRENTRLKKLLQLTDELENCETVPAKVVAYEPGNWFYTVVINKGSKQGIKVSDVVITGSGLIGKVTETGLNWSRVSTVLDSGNAVGIKLTRTGDVGIAEGDAELLKKRRFKLDYISKDPSVISGDLLETSGLGGIYPPGLSVGTVEEIELDNTGELVKAVVRPAVDFEDLYEVVVVTYWEPAVYDRDRVMIEYADDIREEKESGRDNTSLKNETDNQDEAQTGEDDGGADDAKSNTDADVKSDKPSETKEPVSTQPAERGGSNPDEAEPENDENAGDNNEQGAEET